MKIILLVNILQKKGLTPKKIYDDGVIGNNTLLCQVKINDNYSCNMAEKIS